MYRIRFHGRGGQGMKTAGRILGSALFAEGFEVQDAPRYGAERRGAPIFAYVRAAREPILERGVIQRPDLVVVADDSLLPVPAAGVMVGIHAGTVFLICSRDSADTWRSRLNLANTVIILPAAEEVEDTTELPFIGTSCAAAAARLLGVIQEQSLIETIREELSSLGEAIVEKNLAEAKAAYQRVADSAGCVSESSPVGAADYAQPEWVELPFEDARISAPVIHAGVTSVAAKTGSWRTMRPVIDYEHCNRCWWVCSSFCPDGAINVDEQGVPSIDYDHCKGCMVCVVQCPPHAIAAVPEHQAQVEAQKEPQP
jgi:pyruvate ferredoxin oxidoreductase gamma subunit